MSSETKSVNDDPIEAASSFASVTPDVQIPPSYIPHRIFLNHVNTFNCRHIASYIVDQMYGGIPVAGEGGGLDEEAGEGEPTSPGPNRAMGTRFEVIGTLKEYCGPKTEDILFTVDDMDYHFDEIMRCGIIIFDITNAKSEIQKALKALDRVLEELKKVEEVGPKTFAQFNENKIFIIISSVLTWANTKPLHPNDPNFVFTEEDYRKRKCHPNFKDLIDCEREVIKKGQIYPGKLKTYVICSGLIYGQEENDLKYFFRMAWYNEIIPIFGPGNNFLPLIHIKSLAQVVHGIAVYAPEKPQYILAVERGPSTYNEIVTVISKHLGIGKTVNVDDKEAFLHYDISQSLYDKVTLNLRMMPVFISKVLRVPVSPNFVDSIAKMVEEYKTTRKLRAYKIVLHGPPAVGKTVLAEKICEDYHLHYVDSKSATDEMLEELKDNPKSVEYQKLLETNNNELPENQLIDLLRMLLPKNICQNQGFILDDFPRTINQAKYLYETSGGEGQINSPTITMIPNYVFALQAEDQFLCRRIMAKPEEEIKDTKFSEENLKRRLALFREQNTEDNTVLNYFDEIEVHPILLEVNDLTWTNLYNRVADILGDPGAGLGFTIEEQEQLAYAKELDRRVNEEKQRLEGKIFKMQQKKEYQTRTEGWLEVLERLQMEEEKLLEARSAPLRHYLMKFVFPTLTRGLIEVVKMKPDDPVDYLAEFLFRENPEGKMFDPSFNKEGVQLLESYVDL